MRKAMKFLHTIASCGMIGGLACYMIVLLVAPQETPAQYSDMRQVIVALCNYLLIPSLAIVLVTGLLSMAVHRPFQARMWAWIKLLMGLGLFEATLAVVHSKATYAAKFAERWAAGEQTQNDIVVALTYEWHSLAVITALTVANVVLGVWRPKFKRRAPRPSPTSAGVDQ